MLGSAAPANLNCRDNRGEACELRALAASTSPLATSLLYSVLESFLGRKAETVENTTHIPAFMRQPDDAFLLSWREHIHLTGYPENFHQVSTSRPEQMHNIILLSEEIKVPVSLREGGDRVPCPFCSPGSPKFERGRMAYFPDESVVRFVGHKCAKTHFGENYASAERIFQRQMRCRGYIKLWSEIVGINSAISAVLAAVEPAADAIETVRERIEEQAPGFCAFLQRELAQTDGELTVLEDLGQKDRAGNAVLQRRIIGTAAGLSFLKLDARPCRVLRTARAALAKTSIALPDWKAASPEHAATDDILRLGRGVAKALRDIPEAIDVVRDGQAFLRAKNVALIHRWGNRTDTPFTLFHMDRNGRQLTIRVSSYAGRFFASPLAASDHLTDILPERQDGTVQWLKGIEA